MSNTPKDPLDNILDFILSDESPLDAEDHEQALRFRKAIADGENRLARERLERSKSAVASYKSESNVSDLDRERAKRLLERAKAGDSSAQITLAARFGDGSMEEDMEAILEDLAELDDDETTED